jgi:hypothetical protein
MDKKPSISRRSFLRRVVGGAALGGAGAMVTGCATLANTDSDPYDPIGEGYGRPDYPDDQCTDSDRGRYSDPRGQGRNCRQPVACNDSDAGRNADPSGQGRRC